MKNAKKRSECTSILVRGLSSKFTDEAIQMYFENPRSGGGEVTDVQLHGNTAIVTFASPDVFKRVLAKKHEYQGCQLALEKYEPCSDEELQEEFECASVLVSGLSSKTTKDTLQLYFENAHRSGGGEVTDFQLNENSAIVTFASAGVAKKVLEKGNHTLDGCQLTVSWPFLSKKNPLLCGSEQPIQQSRVVRISGDSDKMNDETLFLIFENNRLSGGGQIECIHYIPEKGLADITFSSPEVAERVSQKKSLEFEGRKFTMTLKDPSKETLNDPKRLQVMDISNEVSVEKFVIFMENITDEEVESVVFGSNCNAMVTFKKSPVFQRAHNKCSAKTLGGSHLKIEQVSICDCVEVTGLAPNTTKDTLFFYFDNPKNGGGEVKNIEIYSKSKGALVFFTDPSVVNNVTRQEHTINGAKLEVVPYYPFLGETSANPGGGKKERVVKVDPQTMVFINKFFQQEFDQLLQECRVKYTWQEGSREIVLGCAEPKMDKTTWENSCDAVVSYINQIVSEKITVSQDAWKELCEKAKAKCDLFTDQIEIVRKENEHSFTLRGKKGNVSVLAEQLNDLNSEIEKKIQFEKNKVSENISLTEAQFELLSSSGFVEHLQASNLEVTMSSKDLAINFRGPDSVVREGNISVWQTLSKVKEGEIELPKSIVETLRSGPGKDFISKSLKNAAINAVVSFDNKTNTQFIVTALSREDVKRAQDLINDMTAEESIPLEEEQKKLLQSEKFKELKRSIHQSRLLQVNEEPKVSTLWIAGIKEEVYKAKERVVEFFNENVILSEVIKTDSGRVRFLFKHRVAAIKHIQEHLKNQSVKIIKKSENEILVSGTTDAVALAIKDVANEISHIHNRRIDLDKPGMKKPFIGEIGLNLLSGIENEIECIIERCTQSHNSKPSSPKVFDERKIISKMICSCETSEGKKIKLYQGDITEHRVDVLVNAANEKLKNDSGIAKSIIEKGGKEIQSECSKHISENGDLVPGEVLMTNAGKLPCKQLIHAVGPKWSSSKKTSSIIRNDNYDLCVLAQTVHNSLQRAETFSSIAIPAIGAGGSGFPIDDCAKTLIHSALEYLQENPRSSLTEIHFIDVRDPVIKAFHNEMKTRFGKESTFTDGSASTRESSKGNTVKGDVKRGGRRKSPKDKPTPDKSIDVVPKDPHPLTSAKPMKILINVSDLAKEEADAIVNTVSSDLDLSKNPCAKALSDAAGPQLQEECKKKGSLPAGQILVTDGYNLGCKNVFHVSVADWNKGQGEPILRSLIQSCLEEAHKRGFFNIAFPAIGTGKLGFPREVVASAFFDEADAFKIKDPESSLKEIYLVLFPKDKATIKAFKDEQKKRDSKKPKDKASRDGNFDDNVYPKDISSIGPVRLEITSGDITKQTTDAIAIATSPSLIFPNAGAVGAIIAKEGGPSILKECKQRGPQVPGSVVHTTAGNLQTSTIFHLVFDVNKTLDATKITDTMIKCFKEAESLGLTSIAVPAIGTGKGKMSPKNAAKAILSAIAKFSQENPTSLNHIRVVVFQDHMINDFNSAIEDLLNSTTWFGSLWQGFKGILGMGPKEGNGAYVQSFKNTATMSKMPSSSAIDIEMWLQVFAANPKDLDKAESRIKTIVKEKSRMKEIRDEAVGKLSVDQRERILCFQATYNTSIQIDKKINRIVVRGDSEDVFIVTLAIYDILKEKSEEELSRKYAELLSMNVEWYYAYSSDDEEPYDKETNAKIEKAFEDKEDYFSWKEETDEDTTHYMIDFGSMTEKNLDTGETIKVERKVKTAGIRVPPHWDPQPKDADGKELDVHLAVLDPNTKEYDDVKRAIEKTSAIDIIKIERVQNPTLYRTYMVKKRELDDKNGSNEKKLFHGTAVATCELINHKGFNRSFCGKNATAFGKGVYFARDASYSMRPTYSPADPVTGNRFMYLASVLAGEYTQGKQGMITPPPKDPNSPTITYDSVVNDVSNPAIYVVFHDAQNYPDYLITFK